MVIPRGRDKRLTRARARIRGQHLDRCCLDDGGIGSAVVDRLEGSEPRATKRYEADSLLECRLGQVLGIVQQFYSACSARRPPIPALISWCQLPQRSRRHTHLRYSSEPATDPHSHDHGRAAVLQRFLQRGDGVGCLQRAQCHCGCLAHVGTLVFQGAFSQAGSLGIGRNQCERSDSLLSVGVAVGYVLASVQPTLPRSETELVIVILSRPSHFPSGHWVRST